MLFLPKEVETVITTLQGAGYSPYLVGGCVREMLRGKAPSDYDMTSDALPQEVLRLFGEWAHPTGLQHGTVTVVSGGLPIELTTMRRDGAYRDNRHPDSVTFGTSIEEDLARRDITVNAIAPGWIHVREEEQLRPEDHAFHPSGRVGTPGDIARTCLFLCDEANDFINGQTLTVDGGATIRMIYPE